MTTIVCGDFEWDSTKAESNLAKHEVAFEEAVTAFLDDLALEYGERHDRIRVISARRATKQEARAYEQPR